MKTLTRRDFLGYGATLVMASSASWFGYRWLNRLPSISVNKVGLPLAHLLRDKQLIAQPVREHDCDILILGSGAAALSAAWYLARNGQTNFLLAEGLERNGNNAAYRFSADLSAPSGAHYLPQPSVESDYIRTLLADLGILQGYDAQQNPIYSETDLVHAPDERLFYHGVWQDGLTSKQDSDTQRFFAYIAQIRHAIGQDGLKLFAMPVIRSSQDMRYLDTFSFADWLQKSAYRSRDLLTYLDYCCRDDYGQGIEQVSAFAGLHYFAARGNENAAVLTWQDGLNHLSEKIRQFIQLQTLEKLPETSWLSFRQPASILATATKIEEYADYVAVYLRDNVSGETRLIRAKKVICAIPIMVAKAIVANAEKYVFRQPEYAPWLIGNFVLHRFPNEIGRHSLAWDNVVHGSRGLGYVVATHQQIRVAKPERTILTTYAALNGDTPQNMRRWLLNAHERDLLDIASQDLLEVYGKRFWQNVLHIDLTVRAHAMAVPKIGYLSHRAAQSSDKILFAHSDLSAYSVFEEAAYWGIEAAKKLL